MMRTMAASMAMVRSSSTRFLFMVESRDAIGILILRRFDANFSFATNESVVLILLLAGDFRITLYFPHESECIRGLRMSSWTFSFRDSSVKLIVTPPLKAFNTTACSVVTCMSYGFLKTPRTVAFPCEKTQLSFLFWCLLSCHSLKTSMHFAISGVRTTSGLLYRGQNPVVKTWTLKSNLVSTERMRPSNSDRCSLPTARSLSIPSIFDVNCVPHCILSLAIISFSASSLVERWLKSRFASWFR
mmetsp:Transcript_26225/g.61485  ORF Transcript_26225/g.61485 Transcript_26225/m.61485 type:complete len:244 (-) Transcript_26225:1658-2389(-)